MGETFCFFVTEGSIPDLGLLFVLVYDCLCTTTCIRQVQCSRDMKCTGHADDDGDWKDTILVPTLNQVTF